MIDEDEDNRDMNREDVITSMDREIHDLRQKYAYRSMEYDALFVENQALKKSLKTSQRVIESLIQGKYDA